MTMKRSQDGYNAQSTLKTQQSYVDGTYLESATRNVFETRHAGNDQLICEVETAGPAEVERAVASARNAFRRWSSMAAVKRSEILMRAAAILRERNDELAELETLDTGKPISETRAVDVVTGVEVLEFFAGIAPSIHGQHFDFPPDAFALVRREPVGVCAGIGAWNYPIQIALWKSAPALACGNTMVFKPAEQTPLTALKLAEIYSEAGLPPGVFNVVLGPASTGAELIANPDVSKVTFTGSVETGERILMQAAPHIKKVTLELGGKSPMIIFDDADFDNALNAALTGNFFSTGQVCSNGTRVFVHEAIHDEFVRQLAERTSAIRVGDPFDPATQLGPLVTRQHYESVQAYISEAKQSSATHVCGGEAGGVGGHDSGFFVRPAIFADCSDDMRFVREEVFGPLMSVLSFSSEEDVVNRANDSEYGLSGAVFTENLVRAHRVANHIQAGTVWINDYNVTPPSLPVGGYKRSGFGRENGLQAIEYYTQNKSIYVNMGDVPITY